MQSTVKIERRFKAGKDGLENLQRELEKLSVGFVSVGIHKNSNPYPDGTPTVEVAAQHEFGDDTPRTYTSPRGNKVHVNGVPERAPIRTAFREHKAEWAKLGAERIKQVIQGKIGGVELFEIIGQRASNDVKKTIRSGLAPANSPQVVEEKGSNIPLIDTGHLINSVSYYIGRHDGGEND
jgi:hypothetical protein